jgi:pimeloyl-ACP methyl ester carboxylesterase
LLSVLRERFIVNNYPQESFVIIGHSMGAQIAARLSSARPDLVDAVISIDGSLGFSEELRPVFHQTVDGLLSDKPAFAAQALLDAVYDPTTPLATRRWHARRLEGTAQHVVRETLPPLFFGPDQVGLGAQSETFCRSLRGPFYHLSRDRAQADRMRHWFTHKNCKVDYWSDAGHWIMQDRPEEATAAIMAWIDQLPT